MSNQPTPDKEKIKKTGTQDEALDLTYSKIIYGLSIASFFTGLGTALWISRKKVMLKLPITKMPSAPNIARLETEFYIDPMKEARFFALKTFGLGTLLCSSVFGTLIYGTSWLTGTSNLINQNIRNPVSYIQSKPDENEQPSNVNLISEEK